MTVFQFDGLSHDIQSPTIFHWWTPFAATQLRSLYLAVSFYLS